MGKIIGIDLGTTYSAAAICEEGTPHIIPLDGYPTLPSVVGVLNNGKVAVGMSAKNNQARNPQDTIVEVKRKMGTSEKVRLGTEERTPQEISALILSRIKEQAEAYLGDTVTGAVITCPAYFKDPQRDATEQAGKLAGLDVKHILNEPTAAAYAYGLREGATDAEQLFIVYDLGGGTFDVTVIKMAGGLLEVIGTGGDPNLGGGNFDDCIVNWMMDFLCKDADYNSSLTDVKRSALKMRLKAHAEEGKKKLCETGVPYKFQLAQVDKFRGKPITFNQTLTLETFEKLIDGLLGDSGTKPEESTGSMHWIEEALKVPKSDKHNYTEANLTAVLLVGGSTRVPLVRKKLEKRFPSTPIWGEKEKGINPDEIVALGAAIKAATLDPENEQPPAGDLIDVTGHTLSVAVYDDRLKKEVLAPIIEKETRIPCEAAHPFQSHARTTQSHIRVFQGEGRELDPKHVTMIGEFVIGIKMSDTPTGLLIGLNLNSNGILKAHATEKSEGRRVECDLKYDDGTRISPEQFEQKKRAVQDALSKGVNRTANPLDEAETANPWKAQPKPQPAAAPAPAPPPAGDLTAAMSPILRGLYNRANNCFDRVPQDRQALVLQLVGEVEAAARANDAAKMKELASQLLTALQGVS